jgi:hypothetical protein
LAWCTVYRREIIWAPIFLAPSPPALVAKAGSAARVPASKKFGLLRHLAPVFLAGFKTKYRLLIGVGEPFSTCPPSKQLLVSSKSVSNDVFVL